MSKERLTRRQFLERPFRPSLPAEHSNTGKRNEAHPCLDGSGEYDIPEPEDSILGDFSGEQLYMEVMKLGTDPSNMDETQMRKLLFSKMEEWKQL